MSGERCHEWLTFQRRTGEDIRHAIEPDAKRTRCGMKLRSAATEPRDGAVTVTCEHCTRIYGPPAPRVVADWRTRCLAAEQDAAALRAEVARLRATATDECDVLLPVVQVLIGRAEIRGMERGASIMEGWTTPEGIRDAEVRLAEEIAEVREYIDSIDGGGP